MSIQAGWNSALYQIGLIGKLADTEKKVEDVGKKTGAVEQAVQELDPARKLEEISRNRSSQAMDLSFVGPLTQEKESQRQNTVLRNRAIQARQWESGEFVGPLTAHQQSRLDPNFFRRQLGFTTVGRRIAPEEIATERAQEAAQVADTAPKNTMSPIIEQLRKNTANIPTMVKGGDE